MFPGLPSTAPLHSEKLLQTLVALSPAGVYLTDACGDCTYANARWCEMAGLELSEVLGRGWVRGIHPEDREIISQRWYRATLLGDEWRLEYRMQTPQGHTTWVLGLAKAIRDDRGQIAGYLGVNVDITERKRADERLRSVLESAPDAMVLVNGEGRVLFVNSRTETVFGFSREELLGQPVEILMPERFRNRHKAQRADYHSAPSVRLMGERSELLGRRKDGSEFVAEIALSPIRDDEGISVVAAIRDVTQRKQMEETLRKSEERFDLAVRGTDAGIWDWDLLTDEVYFSPRWKSILGYEEFEIRNHFSEWETRLHPDDRERALATVRDYLDGRSFEYELEHRLQHKDGSYRWILARGAVVRDPSGRAYRMAGSHLDITERKRSEQLMLRREGELVAAQRVQERILPRSAPCVPGYEIAGTLLPAEFAAGDYYDYLSMPDGTLGIVVGDVSGHSVSASLLMAATSAHLRSFVVDHSDIGEIVRHVNALLCQETEEAKFVTLVFVQIDLVSRTLKYLNLAHPSGYVLGQSGEPRSVLRSGALPLAITPDLKLPEISLIKLEPNDIVLLATDGILEAESPEGTPFGTEQMLAVVQANRQRRASEIVQSIQQAVLDFTGRRKPQDDLTAVVIKVGAN